jgi:N utilization substance protein A
MVQVNDDSRAAKVIVMDDMLSLAIGKDGQNARLAAKLTGWKIDVKPYSSLTAEPEEEEVPAEETESEAPDFDNVFDEDLGDL